jgi:protein involved in polysaccharide export with SLBB domain
MNERMKARYWLSLIFGAVGLLVVATAPSTWAADKTPPAEDPARTAPANLDDYRLGAADKVRILVYNEPNLSGEFSVNSGGVLSIPLIGDVVALNRTTTDIRKEIERRLSDGYLRAPQVSIDVLEFRPFYILGEVNKPGDYPYSAGLTVLKAVATANGFTYRADQKHFFLKHPGDTTETKYSVSTDLPLQPGDTIRIAERYF